ncbi:hypothetical protein FO519_010554, partial [Halicephalobus sp. NKZ332]
AMMNSQTNEKITGDKAPMLKDLETWMKNHSKFKVDMNSTLANLVNPPKKASTSSTTASSSKTNNGVSSSTSSSAAPAPSTSEVSASLEPGEIPKASTSTSTSTSKSNELDNVQIPIFLRTGQSVPKEKWPTLKNLQSYLDKNPEANVQTSHVSMAKSALPKSYHNRLGGENEILQALATMMTLNPNYFMTGLGTSGFGNSSGGSSSSSSAALEAASMQMLLQGMAMGYPYSAMGLGSMGTGLTAGSGLTGANLNQFGSSS